jgi:hypothetical protein
VANFPPWSSSGGISLGSRTTRRPGFACGRLQDGRRYRPCPGSEPAHVSLSTVNAGSVTPARRLCRPVVATGDVNFV